MSHSRHRRPGRLPSAAVIISLVLLAGCATHPSSPRGSIEDAEAMLDRAIVHYEQVGREQALSDFTSQESPFVDRDLYVFCYGPDRKISAHGVDRRLIGTDVDGLRDVDGRAFGTEIMRIGQSSPEGGRAEYKWLNPESGEIEPKISVVRAVGTEVCGVGVYPGV